ncbi:MAG TPA: Asp-tRNA(Asn)/Glu-tRNA(Gln) amidotransferase subunit GatC [Candidatus Nanoarchaeia archaeon]|nr:Asp-tRNA(Asn)/Glu-tRNA(Gln) amidotransferase subunit GatC [Candidatus Nanoarchaeia archaeon]
MNITPEIVKRVAANARLTLKEDEVKHFAAEMKDIISMFEKLAEVDTSNVEPSFHPIPVKNVSREDVPGECLDREKALSLTPHKKDGYFRGPKVV